MPIQTFAQGMGSKYDNLSEKQLKGMRTLAQDPAHFVSVCWPDIQLYDKQVEILESIRDNRETWVYAANEMGKDFSAAIGVLYYFCTRAPCRIVTMSPGETQLKSVLWGEIRHRINTSQIPLALRVTDLKIERYLKDGKTLDPMSYILGHVARTGESFSGHHLPQDKARTMVLFDECSGIDNAFYEAAEAWAHRIFGIGNPLNTVNFFFDRCSAGDQKDPANPKGKSLFSKVIQISAEDSPNVKLGKKLRKKGVLGPYPIIIPGVVTWEDYIRRKKKWDEYQIHTRLKGLFYTGRGKMLFPQDWLDGSHRSYRRLLRGLRDGFNRDKITPGMGVDSGEGRDKSCWTILDSLGIIHQHAIKTPDTTEVFDVTVELMKKYKVPPSRVCMDRGGGGKEHADYLRRAGFKVRTVDFGESPTPPKTPFTPTEKKEAREDRTIYKNRRAEMYDMARQIIAPTFMENLHYGFPGPFSIPEDMADLLKELKPLPLLYDKEGQLYLPPKRRKANSNSKEPTIDEIVGHSPDLADSFVLGVYAIKTKEKSSFEVF
jgi:hypothetical protein